MQLWCQDEARIGLFPITHKVWAPRGERPTVIVERHYQWLYLYGFVHPESGNVEWLLLPTVSTEWFTLALQEFAMAVRAGPKKHVAIVLDQAGWHVSKSLKVPEGIHLIYLPAYSPELQPAEHLWPFFRENLANELFESLAKLEQRMVARCRELYTEQERIRSATLFYWWPHKKSASVKS